MDKTRLALIGVGMIGKRHLKAMRDVEEAELAALVDTVPGVSGLAREWSVPFFETTDSMLKEIAPDGVIVCTPTEVHLEPVLQSLDAGAHVLVENRSPHRWRKPDKSLKKPQRPGNRCWSGITEGTTASFTKRSSY